MFDDRLINSYSSVSSIFVRSKLCRLHNSERLPFQPNRAFICTYSGSVCCFYCKSNFLFNISLHIYYTCNFIEFLFSLVHNLDNVSVFRCSLHSHVKVITWVLTSICLLKCLSTCFSFSFLFPFFFFSI